MWGRERKTDIPSRVSDEEIRAAEAAKLRSQGRFMEALSYGDEIRHHALVMRSLRERNHFAELFERSMRPK